MKRYLPIAILLITAGFGCEGCDDYASPWRWPQTTGQPEETQVLDNFPPLNLNYSFTETNNNTSSTTDTNTNSILEDLYPEKYPNSNVSNSTTSLWVNSTDLNINESGTEASWGLQIVEGTATASSTVPVIGVDVTAEFQGGSGEEEVIGVTGADGWVWWIRPKTRGAEQMYITGITGDFPWNSLDRQFWQGTPALSLTAEESQ